MMLSRLPIDLLNIILSFASLRACAKLQRTSKQVYYGVQKTVFFHQVYAVIHANWTLTATDDQRYNSTYRTIRVLAQKGLDKPLQHLIYFDRFWAKDGRAIAFASEIGSLKCVQILYPIVNSTDDKVLSYMLDPWNYYGDLSVISRRWLIIQWLQKQRNIKKWLRSRKSYDLLMSIKDEKDILDWVTPCPKHNGNRNYSLKMCTWCAESKII